MGASTELFANPKAIKKMEKDMAKKAKADEKNYQHTLKELKRTQKSEVKASKASNKADKNLKKMEDKAHEAARLLQKATHNHDQAVTNLHTAQSSMQIQEQQAKRLGRNVDTLRTRAHEQLKAKQAREGAVGSRETQGGRGR